MDLVIFVSALLILIQMALLAAGVFLVFHYPQNVSYILVLLTSIFLFIPAWGLILGYQQFFQGLQGEISQTAVLHVDNMKSMLGPLAFSTFSTVIFLVGAIIGASLFRLKTFASTEPLHVRFPPKVVAYGPFILLWGLVLVWTLAAADWNLRAFLLPGRSTQDLLGSELTTRFLLVLPLAIAGLEFIEGFRWTKLSWAAVVVGILLSFGTPARRDLMIAVLFPLGLSLLQSRRSEGWRGLTPKMIAILGLLALSVPALWLTRRWATHGIPPSWEPEVWLSLLFGSPATGFPTLLLAWEHVQHIGIGLLRGLGFLLVAPIPRSLWSEKPLILDNQLQQAFGMDVNPSMFWFGEGVFLFGVSFLFVALIQGFVLSAASEFFFSKASRLGQLYFAVLWAHLAAFFKLGFIPSSILVSFFLLLVFMLRVVKYGLALPYIMVSRPCNAS